MARIELPPDANGRRASYALGAGQSVVGRSEGCDLAINSASVSRVHCVIRLESGQWKVRNRSGKQGTRVNGKPVGAEGTVLADGDTLQVGEVVLRFLESVAPGAVAPTETVPIDLAIHADLVDLRPDAVAVGVARLRFTAGPRAGETVLLDERRIVLGGRGQVELPETGPHAAAVIHLVRGRPTLEPGGITCFVDKVPVLERMPILATDRLQLGPHTFVIEPEVVERPNPELERIGPLSGSGPAMKRVLARIQALAGFRHPVLIVGESGTGKELAALALHETGARRDGPFVPCNMAAITPELFESELFGHEKGSFSGAIARKDGLFHQAEGGTLFLDEIGELDLVLQAKLLRVLESGEVRRVGAQQAEQPDVRVVAATNRDLEAMVAAGTFRLDVYQRLAMTIVSMPPLRDRKADIGMLAVELLQRDNPNVHIGADAVLKLQEHDWPGNVRELRNVLLRAVTDGGRTPLGADDITIKPPGHSRASEGVTVPIRPRAPRKGTTGFEDERAQLVAVLEQTGGNKRKAEELLGLAHSSFNYRLRLHGLG
jgi:transcriptional regulator with AAA-type ATPase domain